MNSPPKTRIRAITLETVLLAMLLGGLTWALAPDVNEAHYLAKARHFWDREFCANDIFVTSHETHLVFYATHGWLCRWFEFETVAWIGRSIVWLVTSLGIALLSRVFWNRFGAALLVGGLAVVLNEYLNLAGEWYVGGVEGKCYAYGFGFASLAMWFSGHLRRAWILLGLACAFHIVVGLWLVIAASFACVVDKRLPGSSDAADDTDDLFSSAGIRKSVVAMLLALLLTGAGFWPAITQNLQVDNEVILQASKAQSMWRLAHHQLATEFGRWVFFLPLVAVWALLAGAVRSTASQNLVRINLVVLGSVLISVGGVVLSLLATKTGEGPLADLSATLLTLYWFRVADVLVPLGCVINGVWFVTGLPRELSAGRLAGFAAGALIVAMIVLNFQQHRLDSRSGSARQTVILPDDSSLAQRELEAETNWIITCHWIRQNTPADAIFLTPVNQQTFKWYANRAEVASRKDMPQNAEAIIDWLRRLQELYSIGPQFLAESGRADSGAASSSEISPEFRPLLYQDRLPFEATHIVMEQRWVDEFLRYETLSDRLQQIYPEPERRKSTFVVYRWVEEKPIAQ